MTRRRERAARQLYSLHDSIPNKFGEEAYITTTLQTGRTSESPRGRSCRKERVCYPGVPTWTWQTTKDRPRAYIVSIDHIALYILSDCQYLLVLSEIGESDILAKVPLFSARQLGRAGRLHLVGRADRGLADVVSIRTTLACGRLRTQECTYFALAKRLARRAF